MKPTLLIMFTLLAASQVQAGPQNDLLHIAAHAGGVYAMTDISEVVCSKIAGKQHKIACTIVGAVVGNAVNVGYKASQGFPHDTNRAVISGVAGSAAAALVISLDF